MVESVVYGARHTAGGVDHLRSAGDDPGKTRAAPMLAGLAAVAVAFYLARMGELATLNWLVSHLLPYVVFAA